MRASRGDLIVVLLVLAAFAAGNVWLARRGARAVSGLELMPVASAFNGGPSGLRGLYSAWRQFGFEVGIWRRPWSDLPSQAGLLVVASPFFPRDEVSSAEARQLMAWVKAGGCVLLLGGPEELLAAAGLRGPGGHGYAPPTAAERRRPLSPAAPTGLMTGVEQLSLSQERWRRVQSPAVVHAGDRRGPALISRPLGRGQIIALSDPSALTNRHLKEADNAVLAVNLAGVFSVRRLDLASLAKGPVYFDEYHHGLREKRSLASVLVRPPLLWVTLQVVLALLLFLHAASRRFGPPAPLARERAHRASREYVAAMASLYQSAGARGVVLQRLAQGFRREVARALGLSPGAPIPQLAEAAARRSGVDPARLTRVLEVCEGQVTAGLRPKEGLLLWVGSELESLRRQVTRVGRERGRRVEPVGVGAGRELMA